MHRFIVPSTLTLLSVALAASIGWLIDSPDWEPAVTSLSLVAAIAGLFIDRWLTSREQRRSLLRTLVHELYMDLGVVQDLKSIASAAVDGQPKMLPRFYNSSLASVIASGAFAAEQDAKLWSLLHSWMQRSNEVNVRLAFTEFWVLQNPQSATEFYGKMVSGCVMQQATASLSELTTQLLGPYSKESSIDSDTVLFAAPP